MSDISIETTKATGADQLQVGTARDFFALLKPRVMSLVVFTGFVGMAVAPGSIHPVLGFMALLCIAVGAGASGALNMWYDADIDARMTRTAERPIPQGKVTAGEALGFGATLSVISVVAMGLFVNYTAAALLAITIGFYLFIYTMWLKRRTPQNIVIGGAAGAAPPVLGWVAVTGTVDPHALLLFLIIFAWTPPHFWALAIHRREEYASVDIPMLPVTHGVAFTKLHILLYTVIMFLITLLPYVTRMSGPLYLLGAVVLGCGFLYWAIELLRDKNPNAPMETFRYSIIYLMALFLIMLMDHYLYPVASL